MGRSCMDAPATQTSRQGQEAAFTSHGQRSGRERDLRTGSALQAQPPQL